MLGDAQVDQRLIVACGPFASNARDNWALPNDAVSVSNITIGAMGMSVNAPSDMSKRSGRVVVVLAPGRTSAVSVHLFCHSRPVVLSPEEAGSSAEYRDRPATFGGIIWRGRCVDISGRSPCF
jgi:hypothetical protein